MKTKHKIILGTVIGLVLVAAFVCGTCFGFLNDLLPENSTYIYSKEYAADNYSESNNDPRIVLKECTYTPHSYTAVLSGDFRKDGETLNFPSQDIQFSELYGNWWYADVYASDGEQHRLYAYRQGTGAVLGNGTVEICEKEEKAESFNAYADINYLKIEGTEYLLYLQTDKATDEEETVVEDRLVGFYVSLDWLDFSGEEDDSEYLKYVEALLKGEDTSGFYEKTSSRLYAVTTLKEDEGCDNLYSSITFSQGSGALFLEYMIGDDDFPGYASYGDAYNLSIKMGDSNECAGTIGVVKGDNYSEYLHLYKVYQDENGRIYIPSQSHTLIDRDQADCSQTISQKITKQESKKVQSSSYISFESTSDTEIRSFKLTIESVEYCNEKITVKEMTADDFILKTTEFSTDSLPEDYTVSSGAEYLLIERESVNDDGSIRILRELYTSENGTYGVLLPDENGFCTFQGLKLNWGTENQD